MQCVFASGRSLKSLLQEVKAKECIFKSTILMKLKPTGSLQTTVATCILSEEASPIMVSLSILSIVIFVSSTWSPGKNTMVVSEVKYDSDSRAYSESVVQLIEL